MIWVWDSGFYAEGDRFKVINLGYNVKLGGFFLKAEEFI